MDHDHHGDGPVRSAPLANGGSSRTKIVFAVLLAIAAFFLLTEHRAHVFGYLPYLLLLACPLLHIFHHGGHGGHGGHSHAKGDHSPDGGRQQPPRQGT
jgi:hypothetical protein